MGRCELALTREPGDLLGSAELYSAPNRSGSSLFNAGLGRLVNQQTIPEKTPGADRARGFYLFARPGGPASGCRIGKERIA